MADKYGSLYDRIVKYQMTAVCREPLHVGGNDGRNGGILVHPVKNVPFIQARDIYWFYQRNKDLHQQVAPAAVTKYKKHLSKNSEWGVVK